MVITDLIKVGIKIILNNALVSNLWIFFFVFCAYIRNN